MYKHFFKRLIDFVASFIALVIFSPLLLIVTIWLHFANKGGGAFFLHSRAGWNNRVFKVIKFKTMTDEKDENGNLLPDGQRLTKVGRFVRSTSLDELPQLYNVLKGDMSLIGPRPLYEDFLKCYDEVQIRRHEVRPGITGWAQVMYPYGECVEDAKRKLEYDLYYLKHQDLILDVLTIMKTAKTVIFGKGK